MSEQNKTALRKPYIISVIFEETPNRFKQPTLGKQGGTQKIANQVSELVFKYLILRGYLQAYLVVLAALFLFGLILAVGSQFLGTTNTTLTNYLYMFLMLLIIPFLTYFLDVYQAMQLRLGMSNAVRKKSYADRKSESELQRNGRNFEWGPTNLAIINSIMHCGKIKPSHGDLGNIAGVNRQTARGSIIKLLDSGLVYEENGVYHLSEVEFEVSVMKGKNIEQKQLSKDEKRRLKHLFEILCHDAF